MIGVEVGKMLVFPASTKGTFLELQVKQKVFKNWYMQGAFAWGNHYPVYGKENGRYLIKPINVNRYQTQGIAIRAGLSTILKSPILKENSFLMLGGQIFYSNTSENLQFTIEGTYFGNKVYEISRQNMPSVGIGGNCHFFYKFSEKFSISIEGSLSMLHNPARSLAQIDDIQIYPFYLKGAGIIINPRAKGVLFGANTGLKLFYTFSTK